VALPAAHLRRDWAERTLASAGLSLAEVEQGIDATLKPHPAPLPGWSCRLEASGIRVSMDGRGRALDNAFIERLWWSVKYEDIYLKDYDGVDELYRGLASWFEFYGHRRPHQGLDNRTPWSVYGGAKVG